MRLVLAFAAAALMAANALADETLLPSQAARQADSVTAADPDAGYRALIDAERDALVEAFRHAGGGKVDQTVIGKTGQAPPLADYDWLKASGYDLQVKDNQLAGIKAIAGFVTLPRWALQRSQATTEEINLEASPEQQAHALFDADAIGFLYYVPEALGPKLGRAFLDAYQAGEIGKAAALIKASEISTGAAKAYFNYPRPFLIDDNRVRLVPDQWIAKDGAAYSASGGSFPSGHTSTGVTDTLLLALMLPERFVALVDRGAGYGYSRLVLGVHYPLDVIGGRIVAERNVAHFLNDPAYKQLFDEARDQLRAALEKRCGVPLADCAKPGDAKADPWTAPEMADFYAFTLTFDLPRSGGAHGEMQVPAGAEVLLATLAPGLSAEARRAVLARTALGSGYPLDSRDPEAGYWQRLDLHAAALAAIKPAP